MAEAALVRPGPRAQISVRARGPAVARVAKCLSIPALSSPNRFMTTAFGDCFWLGPDEWLVVGPSDSRGSLLETLEEAVGPEDGAAVDVSSSRALFELGGPKARDVLASCCALDLHPRVFGPGQCAQTLLAKASVLLSQVNDAPTYRIFVRPSLVSYVLSWLNDVIDGLRPEPDGELVRLPPGT